MTDEPGVPSPATGRRLALALWPALAVWFAFVGWRAYGELNDDAPVRGLFRTYHPPQSSAVGWVVDPRPDQALVAEIHARYRPSAPPPSATGAAPADAEAARTHWIAALDALELRHTPWTGGPDGAPWTGAPPRLRITAEGQAYLMLGQFGIDPIVFWPGLGVVRVPLEARGDDALPPAVHDLALTDAREPPW